MKICFMGSPEFAATILQGCLSNNLSVTAVYTKPPRPKNRGQKVLRSEVHELALKYKLPVFTPINFKSAEVLTEFNKQNFDVVIVAAYGLILPPGILSSPRLGCINVHASLLPRWRGAAPIQRAIAAGDANTGISIMYMEKGLDTGPVITRQALPITNTTTALSLYHSLSKLGTELMVAVAQKLITANKILPSTPQDSSLATYAPMLHKSEAAVNFNETAEGIARKIRAFTGFPGSYFTYNTERFKIKAAEVIKGNTSHTPGLIINASNTLEIATAKDALRITVLQRAGKAALSIDQFLKGFSFKEGSIITNNLQPY